MNMFQHRYLVFEKNVYLSTFINIILLKYFLYILLYLLFFQIVFYTLSFTEHNIQLQHSRPAQIFRSKSKHPTNYQSLFRKEKGVGISLCLRFRRASFNFFNPMELKFLGNSDIRPHTDWQTRWCRSGPHVSICFLNGMPRVWFPFWGESGGIGPWRGPGS